MGSRAGLFQNQFLARKGKRKQGRGGRGIGNHHRPAVGRPQDQGRLVSRPRDSGPIKVKSQCGSRCRRQSFEAQRRQDEGAAGRCAGQFARRIIDLPQSIIHSIPKFPIQSRPADHLVGGLARVVHHLQPSRVEIQEGLDTVHGLGAGLDPKFKRENLSGTDGGRGRDHRQVHHAGHRCRLRFSFRRAGLQTRTGGIASLQEVTPEQ